MGAWPFGLFDGPENVTQSVTDVHALGTLPQVSIAVMVSLNALPAVGDEGAGTVKEFIVPALTANDAVVADFPAGAVTEVTVRLVVCLS